MYNGSYILNDDNSVTTINLLTGKFETFKSLDIYQEIYHTYIQSLFKKSRMGQELSRLESQLVS
jgi:hypothetical protein